MALASPTTSDHSHVSIRARPYTDIDTTMSSPTFAHNASLASSAYAEPEHSGELEVVRDPDILPSPTRTLAETPASKYSKSPTPSPPAYSPPGQHHLELSQGSANYHGPCDPAIDEVLSVNPDDLVPPSNLEKFSQKWPVPRCATRAKRSLSDVSSMTSQRQTPSGRLARLGKDLKWTRKGHELEDSRWNGYKWILSISIATVFLYGALALGLALMTWIRTWRGADILMVADFPLLVLVTVVGILLVVSAITGMAGLILDSRPILAVYTLSLWPAFMLLTAVGYVAYKKSTFSLDHKLNLAWSRLYSETGRRLIQDTLRCCGYYNPLHQITASSRCYTRSSLPGCKGSLLQFEHQTLGYVWKIAFSLVPLHLLNIFVGLLCSNHITPFFGRGLLPVQYRLGQADVKGEAERLLSQDCRLGAVYTLKRNATLKSMRSVKEAAAAAGNEKHIVFGDQTPNVQ